jgi:pyridoxal 5'-phosphate synthase pdxT subunit
MSKLLKKFGVLSIQGDFAAHKKMLARLGVEAIEIRRADELAQVDGLIMPGGESTTMLKFLTEEELWEPIRQFAKSEKLVFGTCAGAILLAREVLNPPQPSLNLIDIAIERNAYGRQVDSFIAEAETTFTNHNIEAVFIRAPQIKTVGSGVEVLATCKHQPIFVRQKNIFAATFHPELTKDEQVHRFFIHSN